MTVFELFVDDNFHYMDEESRYRFGTFASYDEAVAQAKAIVDEFLEQSHEPGMTSKELYKGYVGFGEDPFIVPSGEPRFSAWEYARARCQELCREEDVVASVPRYSAWPAELAGLGAVLLAGLSRPDLGPSEREALNTLRRAVVDFPNAMPPGDSWYWLRVERGSGAFTVYLYADRFKLHADGVSPGNVEWEIRFRGSGRRDRRSGDAASALEEMRQAALSPDYVLRVSAG